MALPLAARFLTAQSVFAGSTAGLVPTSAGGTTNFLRADGTWAAPSGGGGSYTFSATDRLYGRVSSGGGAGEEITCTAAARSILDDSSVGAIATTLGLGTGDVVTHERLVITQTAANQSGIAISGYSLTGSASSAAVSITGTWNTTGTPNALSISVTDSASNAASKVINASVTGTSVFSVDKTGKAAANTYSFVNGATIDSVDAASIGFTLLSTNMVRITTNSIVMTSGMFLGSGTTTTSADTVWRREGANQWSTRNGTNATALQVWNTYTNSTTYERAVFDWQTTSNVLRVGTEKGSSGGTARDMVFVTDATTRQTISSSGQVTFAGNNLIIATAKTPSSASDTGTTGMVCWDSGFVYVCTATNTWKRVAIATW